MIKLIDGYEIHGNKYDYALVINEGKVSKQTDKKTGEVTEKPVYKPVGYYNTVQGCVLAAYKHMVRKLTADEEMTLKEAMEKFEAVEKRLEEIIPGCFSF